MKSRKTPKLRTAQQERRLLMKQKRTSKTIAVWKKLLESFLLLLLGSGLLAGLSWLPTKIDAIVVVSEAIADLIRGLGQLLEALLGLSAVILIATLLLLGLLAIVAGLTRLFRTFSVLLRPSARRTSKLTMSTTPSTTNRQRRLRKKR